jgi:hypothetical protein
MTAPRRSHRFSARCPRCQAAAGFPCRNAEGQSLTGPHWERDRSRRRAIAAAFDLYRPLTPMFHVEQLRQLSTLSTGLLHMPSKTVDRNR